MKTWNDIIACHAVRYPLATAQDWYKLIYQGTMGAEHLLQNASVARERLQAEWDAVQPHPGDWPLHEAIAPESRIVRLHLRPFKKRGGTLSSLWTAFAQSAQMPGADKAEFVAIWLELLTRLPAADVAVWDRAMASQAYPVCHHSPGYRAAYAPAYRVVRREALDEVLRGLVNA